MPAASDALVPFTVAVDEGELDELRSRLRATRWPEPAPVDGWQQGVPLGFLQELVRYWADGYDWRRVERRVNAVPQFRTEIDGLRIHFLHRRSARGDAFPLVLTHGWPGAVLEFLDVVDRLPEFHVVLPSLPGYGFSDRPATTGWGVERIARAWATLMHRLGYDRYGAAGSDWGTSVSSVLGVVDRAHVAGIHLVPPLAAPDLTASGPPDDAERTALAEAKRRAATGSAYSEIHRTRPQTVGYALTDSPAGLCAWIVEKLWSWSDHADGRSLLTNDQMLDVVSWYWFTRTPASSARLYWESIDDVARWLGEPGADPVDVPAGGSVFRAEVPRPSRRWAARRFPDLRFWAEHGRGGHFAALEVPDLLAGDLREFFARVR